MARTHERVGDARMLQWPKGLALAVGPQLKRRDAMLDLAIELLRLFSNGTLPAVAVQRLAKAAWEDGWGRGDAMAEKLMRAGGAGARSGNAQRDLLRTSQRAGLMEETPDPYYFKAPGPGGTPRGVGCCLPHEQMHKLVDSMGLGAFTLPAETLAAAAGLGSLVTEWTRHPDSTMGGEGAHEVIPLGLHADGVQYTSNLRAG